MKTPRFIAFLYLFATLLVNKNIKAQPNIQHSIYFSQKSCSDSLFYQRNFYLAHSQGGYYGTYSDLNPNSTYAQVFVKYNSNWDTLFSVRYSGNGDNIADKILELPNGNILIAGITESYDNGNIYGFPNRATQSWLLEVDTFGNFVKAKTFGELALLTDASISSDGYILLAGNSNGDQYEFAHVLNGGSQFAWIAKYDTAFNKVWIKLYDNDGYDGWPTIKEVTAERYIVGYSSDGTDTGAVAAEAKGGLDLVVYYIDSSGNSIFKHRYGTSQNDGTKLSAVDPNTKEVYFVNSAGNSGGDITWFSGQCWIHKVDTFGNTKGSKAYGGTSSHVIQDAIWYNNRLWIFSQSEGNTNGADMAVNTGLTNTDDAWIATIDTNVSLVAKYTLQSDYQDRFSDAFISNNELYIGGNITTPGTTPYKCDTANSFKYVIKLGLAPLGINENQRQEDFFFEIYPNPAGNTLHIKIDENHINEKGVISVIDIEGRTVYRKNIKHMIGEMHLECGEWKPGNYVIQLSINKSTQSTKEILKN